MNFDDLKTINKTIEIEAKTRLNSYEEKTKNDFAKKEKRQNLCIGIISLVFLSAIGLFLLGYGINETDNTPKYLSVIFGVVLIVLGILFILFAILDLKKPVDVLALRIIKRELRPEIINKFQSQQIKNKINNPNFEITKAIKIQNGSWTTSKILIDTINRQFVYQKGQTCTKAYSFSDVLNYEVYENGNSKVKGTAGKALIGGAFWGLGGLIVGSSTGKNINEKCTQLQLIVRLNDINNPQIKFDYLSQTEIDKNSNIYSNMKTNIQEICSLFEYMINSKTIEQDENKYKTEKIDNSKKSNKEQLLELKDMLDDGLITQDEYNQKKKQILGL